MVVVREEIKKTAATGLHHHHRHDVVEEQPHEASSSSEADQNADVNAVSFSHVHLYVDHLQGLHVYKALEGHLNEFAAGIKDMDSLSEKKMLWETLAAAGTKPFLPHGRDVVQQLLCGFGFRVTASRYPDTNDSIKTNTRSILVTSRDPAGVQILVTAIMLAEELPSSAAVLPSSHHSAKKQTTVETDSRRHFDASNVRTFLQAHDNRQGIAVLAFAVQDCDAIHERYQRLHPQLVADYTKYKGGIIKVLEVYAYYKEHDQDETDRVADKGTILRFLQAPNDPSTGGGGGGGGVCPLPGLTPVDAVFEDSSQPAYCDHWVSNVFSRTEFLDTLNDTLGFTPKVDFNAGVVAAGEAQIESTVTGNESRSALTDKNQALRDQSQVYLPINNALSAVGHVHGFLKELGQGVQHVASRVENLVDFVQRGNDHREMTGEGFTFLRIPRSYYGILTLEQLVQGITGDHSTGISETCAHAVLRVLEEAGHMTKDGAVNLDLAHNDIDSVLDKGLEGAELEEYQGKREIVAGIVLRSRYKNLYSLLRHHVSEGTYLGIVRNHILVDIQGEDLLYQIFTANILQRNPGEEAPFFEFIQRVCSQCTDADGCPQKVRPGCGGFGIRNFLTLFLSIEVSTAMQEVTDAKAAGDQERQEYALMMVHYLTKQLNESNPILTRISDAMTEEGKCQEERAACLEKNELEEASQWEEKMNLAAKRKRHGNKRLKECSARYKARMQELRETRHAAK